MNQLKRLIFRDLQILTYIHSACIYSTWPLIPCYLIFKTAKSFLLYCWFFQDCIECNQCVNCVSIKERGSVNKRGKYKGSKRETLKVNNLQFYVVPATGSFCPEIQYIVNAVCQIRVKSVIIC
jgi:hypothetical protein